MINPSDYDARGWEVIPSFTPQAQISMNILSEMDSHPEAAGKSSWGTRNVLFAFVLSMRPKVVLEIGGHIGSASVVMGAALRANNFGQLITLEPQEHYFAVLESFVHKAGLSHFVHPLKMYSTDERLSNYLKEKADMVFLDADHSYSHALRDLEICDELIAENGLLFLDDVGSDMSARLCTEGRGGVRRALLDFSRGDLPRFLGPIVT